MIKKVCCNKEYGSEQGFCGVCGSPLVPKYYCDNCGDEVPEGVNFCGSCGTPARKDVPDGSSQPANHINVDLKPVNRINKMVGIVVVGAVALILLIVVLRFAFAGSPLVGKWDMQITEGNYTSTAYIQFKSNGRFVISTFGVEEKGKYKILDGGKEGKIRITPDDLNKTTIETEYTIKKGILTLSSGMGGTFKKE